jgi:hypothetical protein
MEDSQVLYQSRWVSRTHFCAFVYNNEGQKLAKSYDEFSSLIASGLWRANKEKIIIEIQNPIIKDENLNKEELTEENNIVAIKPKRGRKCLNRNNP